MFFFVPLSQCKTSQISLGRFKFLIHYVLDIQVELYTLITVKQQPCAFQIILVYMHIAEVQYYVLQRQVYLPCHEIEMVYIDR